MRLISSLINFFANSNLSSLFIISDLTDGVEGYVINNQFVMFHVELYITISFVVTKVQKSIDISKYIVLICINIML